jgi:hypothetical protein
MDTQSRADLTDLELARIARELREISSGSSWSRTLAIGELVLKHFFRGNVEEWQTHRRQKEASIRRLAQRPDCPLGKSALSEAVAIHVAHTELPSFVDELSPSHVGLALRLPAVQRLEILKKAHAASWSVSAMRGEVLALKRRAGERRGRPRFSAVRAAVSRAIRCAETLRTVVDLLGDAADVRGDTLDSLAAALVEVEDALTEARVGTKKLAQASSVTLCRGPSLLSVEKSRDSRISTCS